jgi:uncharacterized protein YjbJ (UPF0337 family)
MALTQSPGAGAGLDVKLHQEKKAMDDLRNKGTLDQAKGALKDAVGKAIGNEKLQAEGKIEKVKGKIESAVGEGKGLLRDLRDT